MQGLALYWLTMSLLSPRHYGINSLSVNSHQQLCKSLKHASQVIATRNWLHLNELMYHSESFVWGSALAHWLSWCIRSNALIKSRHYAEDWCAASSNSMHHIISSHLKLMRGELAWTL
jgi:hypothetical protein